MSRGGTKRPVYRRIAAGRPKNCAVCIVLIVMSSIFTVGFSFHFYGVFEEARTLKLEEEFHKASLLANADEELRRNVQKITKIITTYNPELPAERQEAIAQLIYDMSVKYENLDIDLICATITHESARTWDPTIVSKAGAIGLMQIMPATGAYLAELEEIPWTTAREVLVNPLHNIRLGCRYLSALIDSYEIDGGLAAYNGGLKRAELWLANNRNNRILWEETRNYIPAVLKYYDEFKNFEDVF